MQFIVLGVLLIVIIPLLINWLILRPRWFNIVGQGNDWLMFWASYLGGMLTAFVGVYTLYRTTNKQKTVILLENKRLQIETLRNFLSERVSSFDYSRMCTIALYIDNPTQYSNVLQTLEVYSQELVKKANSFEVVFGNTNNTKADLTPLGQFISAYHNCIEYFIKQASSMEKQITELSTACQSATENGQKVVPISEQEWAQPILFQINDIIYDQSNAKENYIKPVFHWAQQILLQKQEEIEILEKQL